MLGFQWVTVSRCKSNLKRRKSMAGPDQSEPFLIIASVPFQKHFPPSSFSLLTRTSCRMPLYPDKSILSKTFSEGRGCSSMKQTIKVSCLSGSYLRL